MYRTSELRRAREFSLERSISYEVPFTADRMVCSAGLPSMSSWRMTSTRCHHALLGLAVVSVRESDREPDGGSLFSSHGFEHPGEFGVPNTGSQTLREAPTWPRLRSSS
jgi:hypothetical protein